MRQLRSVMCSFEGFWLPTLMSAIDAVDGSSTGT
jgi:hypothetical protein